MILLDHTKDIKLDPNNPPFNNYQAFQQNYIGLKVLADTVREEERKMHAAEPPGGKTVIFFQVVRLIQLWVVRLIGFP